ncbi:hypothetical protein LP419_30825 [Massilia sp. H-1]|nr:hypothetical protein LP419_30825 [Massilia sp. H-1]
MSAALQGGAALPEFIDFAFSEEVMGVDLDLLERWLTAWSLSRGLPLPVHEGGGLSVEVGKPDHLRLRHVFAEAGLGAPCLRRASASRAFT